MNEPTKEVMDERMKELLGHLSHMEINLVLETAYQKEMTAEIRRRIERGKPKVSREFVSEQDATLETRKDGR